MIEINGNKYYLSCEAAEQLGMTLENFLSYANENKLCTAENVTYLQCGIQFEMFWTEDFVKQTKTFKELLQ